MIRVVYDNEHITDVKGEQYNPFKMFSTVQIKGGKGFHSD